MNSKKTNYLVAGVNVVAILIFVEMIFGGGFNDFRPSWLAETILSQNNFLNFIQENLILIVVIGYVGLGITNILIGINNRKNKKLFLCQLLYGICNIGIIICVVINIVENSLYIIAIIFEIIACIMQVIYNKLEEEERSNLVIKIIAYIGLGVSLVMLIAIGTYRGMDFYNAKKIEKEIVKLEKEISVLEDATDEELLILVEKNNQYGFIDENGNEKISCQYEDSSNFYEINIGNNTYYVALIQDGERICIISKSNEKVILGTYLTEYVKADLNRKIMGYSNSLDSSLKSIFEGENEQKMQYNYSTEELTEKNSKYYYKNNAYTLWFECKEAKTKKYYDVTPMPHDVNIIRNGNQEVFEEEYLPRIR